LPWSGFTKIFELRLPRAALVAQTARQEAETLMRNLRRRQGGSED
jgi:hypothetical protein